MTPALVALALIQLQLARALAVMSRALIPQLPEPRSETVRKAIEKAHADHGKCPQEARCPWPGCTLGRCLVDLKTGAVSRRETWIRADNGDPSTARPEYRWVPEARP